MEIFYSCRVSLFSLKTPQAFFRFFQPQLADTVISVKKPLITVGLINRPHTASVS